MNPEVKAKWVRALRFGAYTQTRSYLHTSEGFCCLGVLCDLYRQEKGGSWIDGEECFEFDDTGAQTGLPEVVREWAGLSEGDPEVMRDSDEPEQGHTSLAQMNDDGLRFERIAAVIEEQM